MMPQDVNLKTLTERAITLYNKTHNPNTKAMLALLAPPFLTVEFTGIICSGCGTQGITDGFASQFRLLSGGKTELKTEKTTELQPRTIQTIYKIKNK